MAKGHWLDPLARSLLQATGRLPRPTAAASQPGAEAAREATRQAQPWPPDPTNEHEPFEPDRPAYKLRQNPTLTLPTPELSPYIPLSLPTHH